MPRPVSNPPNPWLSSHVEWIGEPPAAALEVFEEQAKSIVAENDSPDVGFRFSVNPYRGCYHGCAYCYARPSHQYLGLGAGTDFDRKIVVKVNAPALLEAELARRSWRGETIVFSGITDCYQPLEASYEVTRRCLEACRAVKNPASVITKSALVRRDAKLLGELARRARAHVNLSIPFADDDMARLIEPFAAPPSRRFEALRILSDAGVSTGIGVAPIIPGLNDGDIPELLERAKEAGATTAFRVLLRLPAEVLPVFAERIRAVLPPERVRRVEHAIAELRGGKMYDARFGLRQVGQGPRWQAIESLFDMHCKRLGLNVDELRDDDATTYERPSSAAKAGQLTLF